MSEALQPEQQTEDTDLTSENIEKLEAEGEYGVYFARLYEAALEVAPELRGVRVFPLGESEPEVKEFGPASARHQAEGDGVHPEVAIGTEGWEGFKDTVSETANISAQISAEMIGTNMQNITPRELAAFIFLHELGHTRDYLTRLQDPELNRRVYNEEMASLPVSGLAPSDLERDLATKKGKKWFKRHQEVFDKSYGVRTVSELVDFQDRAYRTLESEHFADLFAVQVLEKIRTESMQLAA